MMFETRWRLRLLMWIGRVGKWLIPIEGEKDSKVAGYSGRDDSRWLHWVVFADGRECS